MQPAASIFKAYDIRGVVPATVTEEVAEGIGKAFGSIALAQGERVVAVGRDGRLSGPALAAALTRGLTAVGIEVIDVGMVTTPMLYFAASTLCGSGIQVTGSHNPKDYNGFKMVMAGRAIYGDDIQAIRRARPGVKSFNNTYVTQLSRTPWTLSKSPVARRFGNRSPYTIFLQILARRRQCQVLQSNIPRRDEPTHNVTRSPNNA